MDLVSRHPELDSGSLRLRVGARNDDKQLTDLSLLQFTRARRMVWRVLGGRLRAQVGISSPTWADLMLLRPLEGTTLAQVNCRSYIARCTAMTRMDGWGLWQIKKGRNQIGCDLLSKSCLRSSFFLMELKMLSKYSISLQGLTTQINNSIIITWATY